MSVEKSAVAYEISLRIFEGNTWHRTFARSGFLGYSYKGPHYQWADEAVRAEPGKPRKLPDWNGR